MLQSNLSPFPESALSVTELPSLSYLTLSDSANVNFCNETSLLSTCFFELLVKNNTSLPEVTPLHPFQS